MLATLTAGATNLVLATVNTTDNATRAAGFFNTPIGKVISAGLVIFGFVVLIFTIFRVVMNALKGNTTGALKNLVIGIFLSFLLFRPAFIGNFIDWAGYVWENITGTAKDFTSKPDNILTGQSAPK